MKTFLFSVLALAGFTFIATRVEAATVLTADGSSLNVTSVPPPGGDGYDFFTPNGGADLSSLPGYASIDTTGDSRFSGGGYSSLTINGTPYTTGVVFQGFTTNPTLATITLGNGVPSNFVLGLLGNSSNDEFHNNTSYIVTAQSDGSTVTVNTPIPVTAGVNDFYYVDVRGAVAGEVLTIVGSNAGQQPTLGGITFDTPEPSSIVALCGLGAMGLFLFARRRRKS